MLHCGRFYHWSNSGRQTLVPKKRRSSDDISGYVLLITYYSYLTVPEVFLSTEAAKLWVTPTKLVPSTSTIRSFTWILGDTVSDEFRIHSDLTSVDIFSSPHNPNSIYKSFYSTYQGLEGSERWVGQWTIHSWKSGYQAILYLTFGRQSKNFLKYRTCHLCVPPLPLWLFSRRYPASPGPCRLPHPSR